METPELQESIELQNKFAEVADDIESQRANEMVSKDNEEVEIGFLTNSITKREDLNKEKEEFLD